MSMNSFLLPINQDWTLRSPKPGNKFFPFDYSGFWIKSRMGCHLDCHLQSDFSANKNTDYPM